MLFVACAIGLSLVLTGYLIQNAVSKHFIEQDEEELHVITEAIVKSIRLANNDLENLDTYLSKAVSGHHGVFYQVLDSNGSIIYFTDSFNHAFLSEGDTPIRSIKSKKLTSWKIQDKHYRGLISSIFINKKKFIIIAAIEMDFHIHFLTQFNYTIWLIMLISALVILIATWLGIHQGHIPLYKLVNNIESIKADKLDMRLETSRVPSELIALVESFNDMLSRLEMSFNRLSNFSDDIAHEIRTPLTNLITQTQVVLSKPRASSEYQDLLYSNLEEQERLSKMVNDMLWLAKSDNGLVALDIIKVNIKDEILACFDFFEALANEEGVNLNLHGDSSFVHFDKIMLRRALNNLLSNAIRHTEPGESILVKIKDEKFYVMVSIENPGVDIPNESQTNLFDRFYRTDPSRQRHSEGAGLGLAIVKTILNLHGGSVEVDSKQGVTKFTMKIPT